MLSCSLALLRADAGLPSEWGFILATPKLLDTGKGGPRLSRRSRVGKEAELQSFVDFHQLVLSPRPLLRGEGSEHSASGSRLCRDALDVLKNLSSLTSRNFSCGLW